MKIARVHIENFRSIEKSKFELNDRAAIVGENNSGKSSILRAINCFFNLETEKTHFIKGDHQYTSNRHPKIELFIKDYPQKVIYATNLNREGLIQMKLTYTKSTKRLRYQIRVGTKYKDCPVQLLDEIKKDLKFVYIPAVRDHRQTIATEKSLLRRLLKIYVDDYLSRRDNVTPKIQEVLTLLENNALKKLSKEIDNNYLLEHKFEIKLSHINTPSYEILFEDLHLLINEKGNEFKLYQCGSGIQSIIIIALYRFLAKLEHQNIIIGIEEPEINLHPHSQKELIKFIKTNEDELQVIFTTHSTVLIDQLDHEEIILVKKVDDVNRNFKSKTYIVPKDFWTRYDIEEFKYYQFYRYRNSDFFFSKFVIICESKNDAEVIKYLVKEKDIDLDINGVSIINLEGVKYLKYPFYLLQHLKIPYLLFLDKDFFLPYSDDEAAKSRNSKGFFKYKKQYQSDKLIKEIVKLQSDRDLLLDLLHSNHSKALTLLEKYNTVCFNYNLEMDLVTPTKAKEEFYRVMHIPAAEQNPRTILVKNRKRIKRIGVIMKVLRSLPSANLPNSYKRIKNIVPKRIKEINK